MSAWLWEKGGWHVCHLCLYQGTSKLTFLVKLSASLVSEGTAIRVSSCLASGYVSGLWLLGF
jgi:hypothetical protein